MYKFKIGDVVEVLTNPYNIASQRINTRATVDKVETYETRLPIRIVFLNGGYAWTNEASLCLIAHSDVGVGDEIIEKMRALKAAQGALRTLTSNVAEQERALDALLSSVGLKRAEEVVAPVPVRVTSTRTALDDVVDGVIEEGNRYTCTSDNIDYYTKGNTYTLVEIDDFDDNQPVAFRDDDRDESYPERHELVCFIRAV